MWLRKPWGFMKMWCAVQSKTPIWAQPWKLSALIIAGLLLFGGALLFPSPGLAQAGQTWQITLEQLEYTDQTLHGPIDQARYYFSLPANWQPQPGAYLQLDLDYTVSSQDAYIPALLEVRLNNSVLYTYRMSATNHLSLTIEMPLHVLRLFENNQINQLQLNLEVYGDCEQVMLTSLTVHATSLLHFNYTERPLTLDLAFYPKPLYQLGAFEPIGVRFILPDEPTQAEVQAAVVIAARLGELTSEGIQFTFSPVAELRPTRAYTEHLIVIGTPDSNPLITQLAGLPLPLAERQLKLASTLPCKITPHKPFTYTLVVENTTTQRQTLQVKDRWPAGFAVLACPGDCDITAPNRLNWNIGNLAPGAAVSLTVQAHMGAADNLSERWEHTASLLNAQGQVLNEDTLALHVAPDSNACSVTSPASKSRSFFTHNAEAVAAPDGVIQELPLFTRSQYAVLVVTGLDDQAVLRAGQALGNKPQLLGMTGNYAIVQDTLALGAEKTPSVEDIALAALGYGDQVFNVSGTEATSYYFNVSRGWEVKPAAALFLHFSHGVALNPLSATIEIDLNRVPIYSIDLNAENVQSTWVKVPLPVNLLWPGANRLGIQLSGEFPECVSLQYLRGLWLAVYADSVLHLPYEESEDFGLDLRDFPQPFNDSQELEDIALALPAHPTGQELEGLLRLSALLGNSVNGDYFSLQTLLGGCPVSETLSAQHLIVVGRPTENCYISSINDLLPQPFISGTNQINQTVDNVIYRLPEEYPLGYIQELVSPWDPRQAVLVVTGSTDKGVSWALNALTDPDLNYQLAGNLSALTQKEMLRSTDTRLPLKKQTVPLIPLSLVMTATVEATVTPTPTPTVTPIPTLKISSAPMLTATMTAVTTDPVDSPTIRERPSWLFPMMIVSLFCTVIVIGLAIRQVRLR